MSRNLRLSSELELAALLRWQRSNRSDMRDAESSHRVQLYPKADAVESRSGEPGTRIKSGEVAPAVRIRATDAAIRAPIYPLVGLCRAAGLPEPVPEYRWHPVRKYRADYALVLERVLIEYDGGLFINGGHSRGKARLYDMAKDRAATLLGWRVLRYGVGEMAQTVADLRILLAGGNRNGESA